MTRALVCLLALACSEPAPGLVVVELTTDYAGVRAVSTRILAEDGAEVATRTIAIVATDDLSAPFRIAELPVAAIGRYEVEATLLGADGAAIAQRVVRVDFRGQSAVLITILRSCEDVVCPGPLDRPDATYCDDGTCVAPLCVEGAPCFDGPPASASIGACRAGTQRCVDPLTVAACEGQALPAEDVANDADDDCDDRIDEAAVLDGSGSSVASDHESIAVAFIERRTDIEAPISHVYVRRLTWAGESEPREPVRISDAMGGGSPQIMHAQDRYVVSYEIASSVVERAIEWVELDARTLEVLVRARITSAACAASELVPLPDGRVVRAIVDTAGAVQLMFVDRGEVRSVPVVEGPAFCVTALAMHHARDELLLHWQSEGPIRPGPSTGHFVRLALDGTILAPETTAPVGQQVLLTSQSDGWVLASRLHVFFEANAQFTSYHATFFDAGANATGQVDLSTIGIVDDDEVLQSVATDVAGRATMIATLGSGTHAFTLDPMQITRRVELVGYGRGGGVAWIDDGVELAVAVDAFDGVRARVYLTSFTDRTRRLAPIEISLH
jgi:hypothetical protein